MQTSSLRIVGLLAVLTVACLCPTLVSAQTVVTEALPTEVQDNWLGGTGNWDDPSMWSAGVSPNNTSETVYSVTIDSGGTDIVQFVNGDEITVLSLTVGGTSGKVFSTLEWPTSRAELGVNGPITINQKGRLKIQGESNFSTVADVHNFGNVLVTDRSTFVAITFTNYGVVTLAGRGAVTIPSISQADGPVFI